MATPSPHGHRLAPLRKLLLALPLLSLLLLLTIHLPARHRPVPPAPLILPTPLRRTTTQRAAKGDPSSSSPPSPTTLSHVVFGIASSGRTLPKRLPLLRAWLRPPARAFLYLDALPRVSSSLPSNLHLRASRNASRFPYTHRRGLPSAVRVARIAKELLLELRQQHQHQSPPPRWLVLGDDDTAFVLPNLLHTLAKYDWREPWYLGARSESATQNALHAFNMAFGGGGIAISWPLAARLARVLDSCIIRYPHLYGSDGRIYACLAELGVELTHEPGFHQIDLRGDISGLLRAHPLALLVSLHHLDHVYPLYPGMDRTKAVEHFFSAANADPARILQQTVCYDHSRSLTASVAWGYSVQVFKGNVPLLDLLAVEKTFVPWRRSRNVTVTDAFMFNTKHYPRDECKRAALFFLKSISSGEGKTESNYSRQLPGKCLPNLILLGNLLQIKNGTSPNLVPPEARPDCNSANSADRDIGGDPPLHTSDSSRIAQEDGTFASEHTSLEVQDSEDQEGNEKAEENKTPDTTTKTPSQVPGKRRLAGQRRKFSEIRYSEVNSLSTEQSDQIWEVINEHWNDTVLFNMGGVSLTGAELSHCLADAKSALKIIKPFVECIQTDDTRQLKGKLRIVIPPQHLIGEEVKQEIMQRIGEAKGNKKKSISEITIFSSHSRRRKRKHCVFTR